MEAYARAVARSMRFTKETRAVSFLYRLLPSMRRITDEQAEEWGITIAGCKWRDECAAVSYVDHRRYKRLRRRARETAGG